MHRERGTGLRKAHAAFLDAQRRMWLVHARSVVAELLRVLRRRRAGGNVPAASELEILRSIAACLINETARRQSLLTGVFPPPQNVLAMTVRELTTALKKGEESLVKACEVRERRHGGAAPSSLEVFLWLSQRANAASPSAAVSRGDRANGFGRRSDAKWPENWPAISSEERLPPVDADNCLNELLRKFRAGGPVKSVTLGSARAFVDFVRTRRVGAQRGDFDPPAADLSDILAAVSCAAVAGALGSYPQPRIADLTSEIAVAAAELKLIDSLPVIGSQAWIAAAVEFHLTHAAHELRYAAASVELAAQQSPPPPPPAAADAAAAAARLRERHRRLLEAVDAAAGAAAGASAAAAAAAALTASSETRVFGIIARALTRAESAGQCDAELPGDADSSDGGSSYSSSGSSSGIEVLAVSDPPGFSAGTEGGD